MSNDEISERFNNLERMIIASRDMPQNETISKLFYAMDKKLDVLIVKQEATHEQACKTNGRVNKAEEKIQEIEKWQSGVIGKVSGISMAIGIVWALVSKLF